MVVACGVAALLALEFISIAIVLGLSDLVGLPWSMLTVGTTWFVAAAAFGLASGTTPARRGALPEAVDLAHPDRIARTAGLNRDPHDPRLQPARSGVVRAGTRRLLQRLRSPARLVVSQSLDQLILGHP